ncbi:MAG: PAS domain S-box protein, partial [Candidatus Omnitrophota bacterium]
IAICLIEAMGNKASAIPVRIFATDVSESGIDKARRGVYGKNIRNDFTPEQLKKFFTKTDNSYKVSKLLREMCIFSKQNVFSDPPFSNVDLISCRNLIIYLQSVLQKEVFHKFHYALRPGGFLLLGNSESVGSHSNLFKMLDKKQRIFVKKYLSTEPKIELSRNYYPPNRLEIKTKPDAIKSKEADIESIIERTVLGEYAPCGVLIDSDMEVVQFRGHTGRFLESPTGKPSLSISKLAAKGLFLPLRAAICKARQTKRTVKREAPDVSYNGSRMRVSITVIPVKSGPLKEEFFLVLFDEIKGKAAAKKLPKTRSKSVKGEKYVESLQKELSETKEYLQSIIEEQENANEEVKTANEEILSSNEELLSTNEELETAKEELQSSNEELITTNEELQNRNKEVILLNNDLINLLNSINMPVIMMGTDLCVRRITPQAEKVLNVIPSDIGRPISKIKLNIDIPDLEKTLSDVIESLQPKTFEIKSKEGNWYSVYIRPYRTLDNQINGVVAIFVDITERKKTQQVIEKARNYAENILETMREPLIVLDTDLKVISANRSFYRTFKVTPEQTKGRFIYDLGNRQWDIPKLRHLLEELLLKNIAIDNYEIEHDFETIGPKAMLFNARRLADMQMVLITIEDITERKKASEALRASEERNRLVLEATMDGFWVVDMQHRFLDVNDVYCRMSGYTKQELLNMSISDVEAIETPAETDAHFQKFIEIGNDRFESRHRRKDGSVFDVEISVQYRPDEGGKLVVFLHDITEQKRAERELARAKDEEFKAIFDNAVDGFVIVDMKTKKFYMANNAMCRMLGYSLEEFKKLVVRDIHPEKDTPYVINQFEKQAKGEISFAADMPVKRKDGSVFYADINASPVIIAGKKYLMGSFRDITERKQMDENTRHMEEMKTTSEIKTKFTSMVSHELRSPLGSIKEGINLVLEGLAGDINEEQRDLLDTAKRNTDRLGRLINNVLDFQKMDSGKIDFDIRENDINEIAGEVNKAMFLLAKEKGLDLAVDLDDSIPMVKFDRDKIVEVLTNLMSNAIKYTERGIITISTKLEDNTVHVIVRDTGRGIEAKDIQRLFQAFEQLDGAKDKKKGGTGLGLAISKEIILAHKGKIWVESEVDKGSSFHFVLPLKMRRKADFCG